jgi:hypothetical protein
MPADLRAVSSKFSPILPKVINEDNNIARGRARGTSPAEVYRSNSAITENSRPFPIRSSIYFHKNCMSSIKTTTKNVETRGPVYVFKTNKCSFFMQEILFNYQIKLPLNEGSAIPVRPDFPAHGIVSPHNHQRIHLRYNVCPGIFMLRTAKLAFFKK